MCNLLILLEQISGQFGKIFVFCLWEHFQYKQQFYTYHERLQYCPCALLTDSKWDSSGFKNEISIYSRNTDDLYPCFSDLEVIMTLPTNFSSFHQHPTLLLDCSVVITRCKHGTCMGTAKVDIESTNSQMFWIVLNSYLLWIISFQLFLRLLGILACHEGLIQVYQVDGASCHSCNDCMLLAVFKCCQLI